VTKLKVLGPNDAFESGRTEERRVLVPCFPRRAVQRER
jgi:hypothetical protein